MSALPFSLLGFGFLLGMKHAFDIDHIAAISTIVAKHKSVVKLSLLGMFWGFGHTISLLVIGLVVLLLKITVPEKIALLSEAIVGLMLILLGLNVLITISKNEIHIHRHKHGKQEHLHFHSHKLTKNHAHEHLSLKKSLIVGLVHGLAGSAALTLLVLSSIKSIWLGLFYILVFGIGSIMGMVLISSAISLPLTLITYKVEKIQKLLRIGVGSISTAVGLNIIYNIMV